MKTAEDKSSLDRAVEFLAEVAEDARTAPDEFRTVPESCAVQIREAILKFRDRLIAARELEAHLFQIRISYERDLQHLLPAEIPPSSRWVRNC